MNPPTITEHALACDILVAGGGPAGVACALGMGEALAKLNVVRAARGDRRGGGAT